MTSLTTIRFFVDGLPPNPNVTKRNHWAKNYADAQVWKRTIQLLSRHHYHGRPFDKAGVHIHFQVGDNRVHDLDNMIASCKPVIDGLKGAVIVDDSIDHIELSFSADRQSPRGFWLEVAPII